MLKQSLPIQLGIEIPHSPAFRYPIQISDNQLSEVATWVARKSYSKHFILSDQNVAPCWLKKLKQGILQDAQEIIIKPGESEKNLQTLQQIWQALQEGECDRKSLLINLGGGVIGDMGGFAASTFMRGISFIQIPTTLLSQVDASVGGKVGINFAEVKNLLGAFEQPQAVFIDLGTLSTLPTREYHSGFAEIVKHGLIFDKNYYQDLQQIKLPLTTDKLASIVAHSCQIKSQVVEQDTRESGLRKILNFGHTVGHAIESLSHKTATPYLHGEAISLGIIAEAEMSKSLGILSEQDLQGIERLLQRLTLPIRLEHNFSQEQLFAFMQKDKKNVSGQFKWTLLSKIGDAVFDKSLSYEQIANGLQRLHASI